MLAQNISHK